jgi:adenine/guanine phosphoribosyltransferase-like PRPP-binding protein
VALIANRRVLFVDDVVATGGTIKAAVRLIEKASGSVVRIETVLLKGRHPGLEHFNYLKKALL